MKNKMLILTFVSVFFILWGLYINFFLPADNLQSGYLTDTYGIIALIAAVFGYLVSKDWGGKNSVVGKALIYLSAGLLMQFLGNLSYTLIYYLTNIENPYPAFGEIFYMISAPLYLMGIWNLGVASGAKFSLSTRKGKLYAITITLALLIGSYFVFIHGRIDPTEPLLNRFLDIYYPLGQTLFVSLAICTYVLSTNLLGGIMRARVLFILFALIFQYFADGIFLYQTRNDMWQPAGLSDLMFIISYFLMGIGLVLYESAAHKISNTSP